MDDLQQFCTDVEVTDVITCDKFFYDLLKDFIP